MLSNEIKQSFLAILSEELVAAMGCTEPIALAYAAARGREVLGSDPEKIRASQGNMSLGENYYYGGLLRFDMSPKPPYLKLKELLQKKWHTEAEAVTDADGNAEFRGFYGKYDVEIDGKKIAAELDLSKKSANEFVITLK